MAITANQAQGLVLALFGASAGGHLTSLSAASSVAGLAADLATSAGLILGKDLSSNTAFRDHVLTSSLKLTGAALTDAQTWMDGEFTKGTARGDILTAAVTYLDGLTDTSSVFYAAASSYRDTVKAAVTWSQGAGAATFGVAALRAQQGNTDVVAGNTFTLTTGTDTFVGNSGNDVINGTGTTFTSADAIVDQTSSDSDALNLTVTGDITATPTVSGIEKINIAYSGFTSSGATGGNTSATSLDIAADNIGASSIEVTSSGSTAVTQLNVTGLATATSIKSSAQFGTVLLDGDDNAALTLNTSASASTVTTAVTAASTAGALTDLTISEGVGALTLTSTDADGAVSITAAKAVTVTAATDAEALSVMAGGNVTITDANSAKTVSITTTAGSITATANNGLAAATSVNLTATKKIVADLGAATEATLSAAGVNTSADTTLKSDIGSATLKTVNLSGNGAAAEFDLVDADVVATINVSGSQAVTIDADLTDLDGLSNGLTLTNTGTGAVTLSLAGNAATDVDLSKVAVATAIVLTGTQADAGGEAIKLASGASVTIDADQTAVKFTAASGSAATNTATITVDKSGTSTSTRTITDLTTTNIKTVNLDMSKDTASTTLGTVDVGSTNNVAINLGANALTSITDITAAKATFTGSGALTLSDLTVDELDASAHTGAISYTSQAGDVVRTGSGADNITVGSATNVYVLTGAGNDTITLAGDNSAKTVYIEMGDGSGDHLKLTDGGNYNASTVSITGFEKVTFVNAAGDTTATVRDTLLDGSTAAIFGTASVVDTITIGVSKATNDFSGLAIDTATIQSGDTFTIDASSRTAAVTITGTDWDDIITGANTSGVYADVLNGGEGNDKLYATEGGDTLTGGDGTDTVYLANLKDTTIEGTSATSTGVVINMSTSAVSQAAVATAMDTSYISKSLTEVAAGKVAYLFAAESTTYTTTVASVATIENVVGTSGADYIIGNSSANTLTGNGGADVLTGGSGADTFVIDVAGADRVTDFATGSDVLDLSAYTGGLTKVYEEVATVAGNIATDANVIVFGGSTNITTAAAAVAADATVTGTTGLIIFSDGTNTYVYGTDDLGGNGTETLLVTLSGITNPLLLVTADFTV